MTGETERSSEALYYAIFGPYTGSAPHFYERAECPWLEPVEAAWLVIRDEIERVLADGGVELTRNFDPYGFDVGGWRTLNLQTYRRRYHAHWNALPETTRVLEALPGLTSAYVNLLEPRTRVPAHDGDSNAVYRCHLALRVPADAARCGLSVGDESRTWREGESVVFCDAHRHAAWNDSDEPRLVLVFDVIKPAYRARQAAVCANVLAAIAVTLFQTRVGVLPRVLRVLVHRALGLAFRLWLPLQRIDWAGSKRARPVASPVTGELEG